MAEERLEDLLARLERERQEADARYHAALTALDHAVQQAPEIPDPPPPYDEQQLTPINLGWDILPHGVPVIDGSLKGRLRGFIWRLVGASLERQKHFNATLVDHLNRNVAAHREAEKAIATLIALVRDHVLGVVQLQHYLIHYLQTVTLYVDTKDRVAGGQAQVLNAALSALTDDWLKRWETLSVREQRYEVRSAALTRAYDDLREVAALAQQTSLTLKRDVERLLASSLTNASGAPPPLARAPALEDSLASRGLRALPPSGAPSPKPQAPSLQPQAPSLSSALYVGFEDRFRGSREEVRSRLVDYLPLFAGASDVVDVGCGRGELLDLFRQHGIGARGIDLNDEMVEACRERGLEAECGDALGYLLNQADESLGGLIAIQVVEHLEPDYLMRFIETARHKLRPGAPMVLETINAACWVAFFESYIRDLSHVRPLHPDTLRYLVQASGFGTVDLQFRAPIPEADKLRRVVLPVPAPGTEHDPKIVEVVDAINAHADRLNVRLFTFMDYAIVARR